MSQDRTLRILGTRVDPVGMEEAQERIMQLLAQQRFAHVVTFGAEMAMLARRDQSYREIIDGADLVVPDTIGVVRAAQLLGSPIRERVAGVELLERVCASCARERIAIFLLGGADGIAQQAAQTLTRRNPGLIIAGYHHGYFNAEQEPAIAEQIEQSQARLVLVALGFPKQELWIRRYAATLGPVVCMGVGGSLDVISGRLSRAPTFMRNAGLEWLYRLVREPRRFARQLVLPQFALLVAGQVLEERFTRKV
jgi:N-acetylglucosaminyldiphosphoundecaprenol N-acetyl-beta-D-mannosaminyltransferase